MTIGGKPDGSRGGPIRALIFDFDGLILDTEVPDFLSWQEQFAQHGAALAFEAWADCIGRAASAFDPHRLLETQVGRSLDQAAIRDVRRRRYLDLVAAEAVRPGVLEYLAAAERLGLGLAVASSGSGEWVRGHLGRLGLGRYFTCVRCCEDAPRAKPDPDLYLAALDALGVGPDEAIAFEDSPNGVRAAKAAGLYCVAVPNKLTERLDFDEADLQLRSLADLPLEALLQRVRP